MSFPEFSYKGWFFDRMISESKITHFYVNCQSENEFLCQYHFNQLKFRLEHDSIRNSITLELNSSSSMNLNQENRR